MNKLIDSDGKEHVSVGITRDALEKPRSMYDPPAPYQEYEAGLTHYFVDEQEISETEFRRLFPHFPDVRGSR